MMLGRCLLGRRQGKCHHADPNKTALCNNNAASSASHTARLRSNCCSKEVLRVSFGLGWVF
jgi:hypothetical protein